MNTLSMNEITSVKRIIRDLESWRSVFNFQEIKRAERNVNNELSQLLNDSPSISPSLIHEFDEMIDHRLKAREKNLIKLFTALTCMSAISFFQGPYLIAFTFGIFLFLNLDQRSLGICKEVRNSLLDSTLNSYDLLSNRCKNLDLENEKLHLKIKVQKDEYHNLINELKNQHESILEENVRKYSSKIDLLKKENRQEIKKIRKSNDHLRKELKEYSSLLLTNKIEEVLSKQEKGLSWKDKFCFLALTGAFDEIHEYCGRVDRRTSRMMYLILGINPGSAYNYVKHLSKYGIEECTEQGEISFILEKNQKSLDLAWAYVEKPNEVKRFFE